MLPSIALYLAFIATELLLSGSSDAAQFVLGNLQIIFALIQLVDFSMQQSVQSLHFLIRRVNQFLVFSQPLVFHFQTLQLLGVSADRYLVVLHLGVHPLNIYHEILILGFHLVSILKGQLHLSYLALQLIYFFPFPP